MPITAAWKAAEKAGLTSAEGCRFLEEAQGYAQHGPFLGEIGDRWCYARRDEMETSVYRIHLCLAQAYEAQREFRRAETQLEIWLRHDPLDIAILSKMLLILEKQGLTAEALRRYRRAVALALRQGIMLPAGFHTLAQRLQHSLPELPVDVRPEEEPSMALLKHGTGITTIPWEILTFPPQTLFSSTGSLIFDLKRAGMLMMVEQWCGRARACGTLQAILAQEIAMFDHLKTLYQSDTYLLSRRQTLGALVALPTAVLAALQRVR